MCAVVLCVSSGWGAAKSEAWGAVHLRGGCLATAAVAVAAYATEGVLRRRAGQTVVEALWWGRLAAIVVYFYGRMSVCIQTFGVAYML